MASRGVHANRQAPTRRSSPRSTSSRGVSTGLVNSQACRRPGRLADRASFGLAWSASRAATLTAVPNQSPPRPHCWAGVDADPNGSRSGLVPTRSTSRRRATPRRRVARPNHHAVAHRLDLPGAVVAAQRAHRAPELARQVGGGGVAKGLGQGRVADQVGEQESGGGLPARAALLRNSTIMFSTACINMRFRIKLHLGMKRKRKTQAERREETREEVLAAASRVFAEQRLSRNEPRRHRRGGRLQPRRRLLQLRRQGGALPRAPRPPLRRARAGPARGLRRRRRRHRRHQPPGPARRRARARRDDRRPRVARPLPRVPRPRRPRRRVPARVRQAHRRDASALEEVVIERTAPVADALGWSPSSWRS